jgi:hypothetical protein
MIGGNSGMGIFAVGRPLPPGVNRARPYDRDRHSDDLHNMGVIAADQHPAAPISESHRPCEDTFMMAYFDPPNFVPSK